MSAQPFPNPSPLDATTYTIAQAAAKLDCSEKTVRRLIRQGTLPAVLQRGRRGDEYRIDAASLDKAREAARKPARLVTTPHADMVAGELYRQALKDNERKAEEIGALRRAVEHELPALMNQRDTEAAEKKKLSADLAEATRARAMLEQHVQDVERVVEQERAAGRHLRWQRLLLLVAVIALLVAGAGVAAWRVMSGGA